MADSNAQLSVLIEIQAQLQGLQATVSGMSGLDGAAASAASTLQGVSAELDAIRGNLGGLDQARSKLEEVTGAGQEFFDSIKAGFALDVAGRITGQIVGIGEAFKAAGEHGVEYDAKMQAGALGLAGALRSIEPGKYLNFEQAQNSAGIAMDVIRQRANALGLDVHSVMEAESADLKALVDGGITDTGKQLDVVTTLIGAAATKGITGVQALKDSIDILNGRAGNITLAKELGLESEALKQAAHDGQLYEFMMSRLGGYREAILAQAGSYQGVMQTFHNLMEQIEGDAARPVFDALQKGVAGLNKDLAGNGGLATELRDVGHAAGDVVSAGVGVTRWAVQNAGAIAGVSREVFNLAAGLAILKAGQLAIGVGGAARNFISSKAAAFDAMEAAEATKQWAAEQFKQATAANAAAAAEERLAIVRREADASAKLYGQWAGGGYQGGQPQMFGPPVPSGEQFAAMEKAAATAAEGIGAKFTAMFETVAVGAATMGKAIFAALGPVGIAFLAATALYEVIDHAAAAAEKREQDLLALLAKAKSDTMELKRQLDTASTVGEQAALVKTLDGKVKELTAMRDDAQKAVDALEAARVTRSNHGYAIRDDKSDEQVTLERTLSLRQGELDLVDRIRGKAANLSEEELNRRSVEQAITSEIEQQNKSLTEMVAKLPGIIKELNSAAQEASFANQMANAADASGRLALLRGRQSQMASQAANLNAKAGGSADTMFGSSDDVRAALQPLSDGAKGKSTEELQALEELKDLSPQMLANETQISGQMREQTAEAQRQAELSARSKSDYDYRLGHAQLISRGEQGAADQMERQHGIAELATKLSADRHKAYGDVLADATKLYDTEVAASDAVKGAKDAKKEGAAADRESLNAIKEQAALSREIEQDKLKSIQSFGQRVQDNPMLGEDAKAKLMMSVYAQERQQLQAIIQLDSQRIALERNSTNPGMAAQLRADTKGLSDAGLQLAKVNQQMHALTFTGTMQASLTKWVNQFGSTAQQASQIITTTLGHAVDGLSSALSGLVLGTENWKQAFAQAGQSIIQDIIRIAIQFVVSRAVMWAMDQSAGSAESSTSNALAQSATASWETPAILASIASYGVAAGVGAAAVTAAVAAGQGMAAAGYAAGGYTGDGLAHEIAGAVHRGEYVMDAGTVSRGGGPAAFDRLRQRIHASDTTSATHGIGPGGSGSGGSRAAARRSSEQKQHIHIVQLTDDSKMRSYMESAKGQTHLVNLTKKNRRRMGIRT